MGLAKTRSPCGKNAILKHVAPDAFVRDAVHNGDRKVMA